MKKINLINGNTTKKQLLSSLNELEYLFDEMLKVQALEPGHSYFGNIGYYIDTCSWGSCSSSKDMYFVLKFNGEEVTHESDKSISVETDKVNFSLESFIKKVKNEFLITEAPKFRSIRFMGKRYKLVEIE